MRVERSSLLKRYFVHTKKKYRDAYSEFILIVDSSVRFSSSTSVYDLNGNQHGHNYDKLPHGIYIVECPFDCLRTNSEMETIFI